MQKNVEEIAFLQRVLKEIGVQDDAFDEALLKHLDKAISVFMENAYFKEEYAAMPTELLKGYDLLIWVFSQKGAGREACCKLVNKLEERLTVSEWEHLIKTTPNITAKIEYSKRMRAAKG